MRTKQVKIAKIANLKFADYNPRQIEDHDMASLVNSIREFGIVEPVVVNKNNTVIGGHQRLIACKQLSIDEVPVVYVDLPKKKEKILNLALNRIHGDWDMGKLSVVLEELKLGNGDEIELTGFELGEIDEIMDSQIPEDETEDNFDGESEASKIKNPISKRGEVYRLGRHRLMCGDATVKADVEKLMDGKKADMVFTDPPYAIYGSSTGVSLSVADDKMVRPFFRDILTATKINIIHYGHIFISCDWRSWSSWWEISKEVGLQIKNMIVWDKESPGMGSMFMNQHELILFAVNHTRNTVMMSRKESGTRKVCGISNLWRIKREKEGKINAQKPIELCTKAIESSTDKDNEVLDLFGGSGTTLIAAEKTGRVCYMMEIDAVYCDVIQKRYEEYVRQSTTKTTN